MFSGARGETNTRRWVPAWCLSYLNIEGRAPPFTRDMRTMVQVIQRLKKLLALIDTLLGCIITILKRTKRLMASIIVWLIGFLFIGLGIWIIMLRSEEFLDKHWPHNMLVGQMTVDGQENKIYAELLRARFDYHFRRPVAIPVETGFLEVLTLDTPELFQRAEIHEDLRNMNIEVSGVDVGYFVRIANKVLQPDRWVIEGDFQIKPDRALLALRMMRGQRLIRTWYLERLGNTEKEKSILLEQLIDDAIFQLAYDFANTADKDKDMAKWRKLLPIPEGFSSPETVAAYFEARAALGRYYAQGSWLDLDVAIERLRFLRRQMPKFIDGLQMLGIALAERRNEVDAIHVYEQLLLLLQSNTNKPETERRRYAIQLMKATAITKLYTPTSAHAAISELEQLDAALEAKTGKREEGDENLKEVSNEQLAYIEMRAHVAVQLAYTYALYLSYVSRYQVAKMFGVEGAPEDLRIKSDKDINILNDPERDTERAKEIVIDTIEKAAAIHQQWIEKSEKWKKVFDQYGENLKGGERRKKELSARLNLAMGYAYYLMAEIESSSAGKAESIFNITYNDLLKKSAERLLDAEDDHANHYQVLQLLGQVYSEPRRSDGNSSIAEQYFERAIVANPSDYWGHVLFADLIYRRILNTGLDLESRDTIQRGLEQARAAVQRNETSGSAQLLHAKFLGAMLEIERDKSKRQELSTMLDQSIEKAARFLPYVFGDEDVDLAWVRLSAAIRRLGEQVEVIEPENSDSASIRQKHVMRFEKSKEELMDSLARLIRSCERIENRWIAQQRVFHVSRVKQKAIKLKDDIRKAPLDNWRTIHVDLM